MDSILRCLHRVCGEDDEVDVVPSSFTLPTSFHLLEMRRNHLTVKVAAGMEEKDKE